jgi:hypothetical protein
MNWGEVGTRAGLTFVQAFLAVLLVEGIDGVGSVSDLQAPVIAAVAAVLSLVYRIVKEYEASKGYDEEV